MAGSLFFPVQGPITSPFGNRSGVNPLAHNDFHTGIDFGVASGTAVYATHSGYLQTSENYGGGHMITVNGTGGWQSVYAHLSRYAVSSGAYVQRGQLIGFSGRSGAAVTGAHLHYEVKYKGQHMDPMRYQPMGAVAKKADLRQYATTFRNSADDYRAADTPERRPSEYEAKGILGEYTDIAKSQRMASASGPSATVRAPKLSGYSSRKQSRFAV